jgi:hypothetical protein
MGKLRNCEGPNGTLLKDRNRERGNPGTAKDRKEPSWKTRTVNGETREPQRTDRNPWMPNKEARNKAGGQTNALNHTSAVKLTRLGKTNTGHGPSGPRETWLVHPRTGKPVNAGNPTGRCTATHIPSKPGRDFHRGGRTGTASKGDGVLRGYIGRGNSWSQ